MEQITAKDLKSQFEKETGLRHSVVEGLYSNEYSLWLENKLASLRSVSETKPDEDSFQQYLLELGVGAKERDLIIAKYGVPVSEVGQMEESEIQKLAFEKYPVNEQGLVSGWEDINRDLREGFIEGLKMRLPVPNTKTKWDRLNSELDTALANMTDEDWDKIKNKRSKKELPNTKTQEATREDIESVVKKYDLCPYEKQTHEGSLYYAWITRLMLAIKSLPVDTKTVEGEEKFHIKKTMGAGEYFLSPQMSRWIPAKSAKHKFGFFLKSDADAFIEAKRLDNPETLYELVPVLSSLRSNTEEKEFSPMAFALRSNEPEREIAIPTSECIENWWAQGKDENPGFWKEAPFRTNGDVIEEIKDAITYFFKTWQRLPSPPLKALSEILESFTEEEMKNRASFAETKENEVSANLRGQKWVIDMIKMQIDGFPVPEVKEKGEHD